MEASQVGKMDSGDEQDVPDSQGRKKRYHRHTPRQIQELESYALLSSISFALSLCLFGVSAEVMVLFCCVFWGCSVAAS